MRATHTENNQDFETVLLEELKIVKREERHLQQLFSRLRSQPQLRDCFLLELSEVRQRTDRLQAVLNPLCAVEPEIPTETPTMPRSA